MTGFESTQGPVVSVIVVSFNTRSLLAACLRSIDFGEVIVVDNASNDGSADMVEQDFPHVTLIRNVANRGFGAANNQGLEVAKGSHALLLNSDIVARPGAIQDLVSAFQGGVVAAGGALLSPNTQNLQESAAHRLTIWAVFCEQTFLERLLPGSRLFSPYWMSRRLPQGGEVAQVMGACLMMRRIGEDFLKFDERFFLYCEDTELCHRLRASGQIVYRPSAKFEHELGASSRSMRWQSVALYNFGKEQYFGIHRGHLQRALCCVLNRFGAILRILASGLVTPKARLFWKVLFVRNSRLPSVPPL